MLAPKGPTFNGRLTFANPMYLKKAQSKKPCLYEIPYDKSDPANKLILDKEETLTLEKESRSKLNIDKVRPYDYTKLKLVEQAWEKHSHDHFCALTAHDMKILIKTYLMPLAIKTKNDSFTFIHELKQEIHADLKYVESLEKEINELESDKAEFSNMYDILLQECVSNDILSKQTETISKEVYTELLRSFAKLEKHSISLELALQQCQEQMKNDTVCKEKASNVFLKEREQYFKIQDLKAQLQDNNIAICELNKLIEKCKGKYVETKFDKPYVVRQPNAQWIPKPSVLGKPTPFSDSLERTNFQRQRVIHKTNVSRPQLRSTQMKDNIIQLILFIIDSGCTKHMMGNLKLLCNFVEKYLGTVLFGNVQFSLILGINMIYYVECLNHNLFSVGQFCNADLEVAFQKFTCFVRDLQGNDLLTGNCGSDLYTISLQETNSLTLICFIAKASPTQAWLWHRRLSHLNFDYINLLSKKDVVISLKKLKYVKDQLCSSCKVSKAKRSSFKTKVVPSLKEQLNLLHIDLCSPMRVASKNGKKYILVILDDYSRYTWTLFLRSKDETTEVLKDFLIMIQQNLQAPVIYVRTDRGIEVLNKTLHAFFKEEGIEHQTSTPRTPEQNDVASFPNDKRRQIMTTLTLYLNNKNVSPSADTTTPSQQKLDLLFGPLYDEFFNAGTSSVNKPSSPINNSKQQDIPPTTNNQSSTEPTTLTTNVHAEENNDNQEEDT
ncbi:retrovirus-related pol polyprotein from transposon TNT 1-94 [Tanacetum coccineum]